MSVRKLLDERNLPPLLRTDRGKIIQSATDFEVRRGQIKKLLQEMEYGYLPKKPDHMRVVVTSENPDFCAGGVIRRDLELIFELNREEFSFPAVSSIPRTKGKVPAFVYISPSPLVPNEYLPIEEITDRGYAVFSFCSEHLCHGGNSSPDRYLRGRRRGGNRAGEVALWAWGAMRVMDYLEVLDGIDSKNVAIIGHSHQGTAALLAGGFDERFKYVIANGSGGSGASLSRGKRGQTPEILCRDLPQLFCPNYTKESADSLPFDQHFLLALSVPRHILIGCAKDDGWSDPEGEFLSLAAVGEVYELYGKAGLVHEDRVPKDCVTLHEGDAAFHIRQGSHYLSRRDWNLYMEYIEKHKG